jgi:cob(I)alamin adenosyltransferase
MKTVRKSPSPSSLPDSKGLAYLFTGDGKGKTSAALGTAVRALGNGWNVCWIAFYKEASWGMSEYEIPSLLLPEHRDRFEMHLLGKGFYIRQPEKILETGANAVKLASLSSGAKVIDDDSPDTHVLAAEAALDKATEILDQQKWDVLVLDEICNAISDGLLQETVVLDLLEKRGRTHIVLTGRSASDELIAQCDLASEVVKRKHPYDKGVLAVKGLDY